MSFRILLTRLFLAILLLPVIGCNQQKQSPGSKSKVTVTVDLSVPEMISNFEIGVTHVHTQWDKGNPEAVARVISLMGEAIRIHNQHITHWGVDNDLMPGPGKYEWETLDHRMNLIRSINNSMPVITFCGAPQWMKDYDSSAKWQVEVRVRDKNVTDFASLCRKVALRYPDVKYFQVWNEFKGYRSTPGKPGVKDYMRFTNMYNAVYDSVKAVRPDVKIGGPYLPKGGRDFNDQDKEVIDYWLKNGKGADFFTYDGWLEGWPPGGKTEEWMMGRTNFFGNLSKAFAEATGLPVWVSEFYAGKSKDQEFNAANSASCYYNALKSGTHVALLWDAFGLGGLFTKTDSINGGQPTPHYFVVKIFNKYFGPGTQLFKVNSSSPDIDVLASRENVLLINKLPEPISIVLNRKKQSLNRYEVRLVDSRGRTVEVSKETI